MVIGGLVIGGLVDWWIGGLVDWLLVDWWIGYWWIGGLVIGGLVDWWIGGLVIGGECSEISVEGVQKSVSTVISPHTPEGKFIRIGG